MKYLKNEIKISLNPLADFTKSSEAKKRNIIRQQKYPNKFLVSWYQLAKARMRKSISQNGDIIPVLEGIEELINRHPMKQRQILDKHVSIEAMQRYMKMNLPDKIRGNKLELIKDPKSKSILINNLEVVVSPDLIFKINIDGKTYLGAIKLHISKSNIFESKQSSLIATLLHLYLRDVVAERDDIVSRDLCLSIDVFGESIVSAPMNLTKSLKELNVVFEEIRVLWDVA
jgi:hypothetical protein